MPSEEEFCKLAKAEYSYDAWGKLRNPATHVAYAPGSEPALFLARGYTGHSLPRSTIGEHLPWFGLININARLYDAALGRFLSPDPYVQLPDFSQNFNRYSYALNNPLVYVDEDGEFFFTAFLGPVGAIIDAACWGAVIGGGYKRVLRSTSIWDPIVGHTSGPTSFLKIITLF